MIVRDARAEDAEAMARVIAAVAEEGIDRDRAPVDVAARAGRFRESIESEGPDAVWALEDDGRIVGNAGVHEAGTPGVLVLGMALLLRRAAAAAGAPCWRR